MAMQWTWKAMALQANVLKYTDRSEFRNYPNPSKLAAHRKSAKRNNQVGIREC